MELLLKREQRSTWNGNVRFDLWAKTEMEEDNRSLLNRYGLAGAVLLEADDRGLLKWAVLIGFVTFLAVGSLVASEYGYESGAGVGLILGIIAGYWWMNEKRETIFVRDLIHGRKFKCKSVIDIARKEALLDNACLVLRQVVESAKHWDGVEHRPIAALPPQEAKDLIVKVFR